LPPPSASPVPARPCGPWNTTRVSAEKRRTAARFFQIILLARSPALLPNELSARPPSRRKLSSRISLVAGARGEPRQGDFRDRTSLRSRRFAIFARRLVRDNPEPEIRGTRVPLEFPPRARPRSIISVSGRECPSSVLPSSTWRNWIHAPPKPAILRAPSIALSSFAYASTFFAACLGFTLISYRDR